MLTEEEMLRLLDERYIIEPVVVHNNVQKSLRNMFCDYFIYDHKSSHFCRSRDPRMPTIKYDKTYHGETLREVIADMEENCPVLLSIIENCVGGFDFKLEYVEKEGEDDVE